MKKIISFSLLIFLFINLIPALVHAKERDFSNGNPVLASYQGSTMGFISYNENWNDESKLRELNDYLMKNFPEINTTYGVSGIIFRKEPFNGIGISDHLSSYDENGFPMDFERTVISPGLGTTPKSEGDSLISSITNQGSVALQYDKRIGPAAVTTGNYNLVKFKIQKPYYLDGTTFVPLREVFNSLKVEVKWNAENKSITANNGNRNIQLFIDKNEAFVNGQTVKLEKAPFIDQYTNVTMLPLRFISESLGYQVVFVNENQSIHIHSKLDDNMYTSMVEFFNKRFKAINNNDFEAFTKTESKNAEDIMNIFNIRDRKSDKEKMNDIARIWKGITLVGLQVLEYDDNSAKVNYEYFQDKFKPTTVIEEATLVKENGEWRIIKSNLADLKNNRAKISEPGLSLLEFK